MYLTHVEIRNIRSIEHLEMEFPEPAGWHVLIGDNGAGKSSILQAIALALMGPKEALSLRLQLQKYLRGDSEKAGVKLRLSAEKAHDAPYEYVAFFPASFEITKSGNTKGNGKAVAAEGHSYVADMLSSGKAVGWFSASFGPFRRFTGGSEDWERVYKSNPIAAAHLSVFGEDVALTESLEWLRQLNYQKLEGNREAARLLNGLIAFINEGKLLPQQANITGVSSAGVQIADGNGFQVDITEMSDGFRSILSLTFELLRQMVLAYGADAVLKSIEQGDFRIPLSGIVMVDEIDAHLHPTWQARIGQWFTHYFPNLQFIVTTHSPIVCRAAEKGSVWRLAAPGSGRRSCKVKGTELKRLIYGNILEAYGTELFGENTTSSPQTTAMLEQLAQLNKKSILGTLSPEEKAERDELISILPTKQGVE
jgi:predicted ATPase